MGNSLTEIAYQKRGKLLSNQPLAEYTSWRIGGPADQLYLPADLDDLRGFLAQLPATEPLYWLGLGSNTLVTDKGVRGTVIITQGRLNQLSFLDHNILRVEAGVSCAKVARTAARQELSGIEFLAGIPGTIGGALYMNAGCFDGETWNFVSKVESIDRKGNLHIRLPEDYQVSYRHTIGPKDEWFVAAHFALPNGDKKESLDKIKHLLEKRAQTQPTGDYSCGSVFRNPTGNYAAQLIESCGLKGKQIGGAFISPKHANFIVNSGGATASDILALIEQVVATVNQVHGIKLIREVHIIGE